MNLILRALLLARKLFKVSKSISVISNSTNEENIDVKTNKEEVVVSSTKKYKIVIDPGHGGKNGKKDPGAVGKLNGEQVFERDVVLDISIELALLLEAEGLDVILTRIDNEYLSTLPDKVSIIKKENPDLVLSIHANSNEGKPGSGIETFYYSGKPESKKFAYQIQLNMLSSFPDHKDRGIKVGDSLYILKMHKVERCCLVECEFINNPAQAEFLIKESKEIASALRNGVIDYINGEEQ